MIVTAFDLGADPYLVYVLKRLDRWNKPDGALVRRNRCRASVGWVFVSFVHPQRVSLFHPQAWISLAPISAGFKRRTMPLVPLGIYGAEHGVPDLRWATLPEIKRHRPVRHGHPACCAHWPACTAGAPS